MKKYSVCLYAENLKVYTMPVSKDDYTLMHDVNLGVVKEAIRRFSKSHNGGIIFYKSLFSVVIRPKPRKLLETMLEEL